MTTLDYLVQSLAWVFLAMLLGGFLGGLLPDGLLRKDEDR